MTEQISYIDLDPKSDGWGPFLTADVGLQDVLAEDLLPGRAKYVRKFTDGPLDPRAEGPLTVGAFDGGPSEPFDHEFPHAEVWYMIEGEGLIQQEEGPDVELIPGRLLWFPRGHRGRWHYKTAYRGIFVHVW